MLANIWGAQNSGQPALALRTGTMECYYGSVFDLFMSLWTSYQPLRAPYLSKAKLGLCGFPGIFWLYLTLGFGRMFASNLSQAVVV